LWGITLALPDNLLVLNEGDPDIRAFKKLYTKAVVIDGTRIRSAELCGITLLAYSENTHLESRWWSG
jgi:hypothetical protein